MSFSTVFEGQESVIDYSTEEGTVVGVNVAFHVDAGSGYFEIVAGNSFRDDDGFLEFESGEVLYTSEEFSEGETVSYEYGETE